MEFDVKVSAAAQKMRIIEETSEGDFGVSLNPSSAQLSVEMEEDGVKS